MMKKRAFLKKEAQFYLKKLVIRMYDEVSQTFVYLAYFDKLIDGSPNNSISVVPCNQAVGNVCEFQIKRSKYVWILKIILYQHYQNTIIGLEKRV